MKNGGPDFLEDSTKAQDSPRSGHWILRADVQREVRSSIPLNPTDEASSLADDHAFKSSPDKFPVHLDHAAFHPALVQFGKNLKNSEWLFFIDHATQMLGSEGMLNSISE
jgi:hypothetical protein